MASDGSEAQVVGHTVVRGLVPERSVMLSRC